MGLAKQRMKERQEEGADEVPLKGNKDRKPQGVSREAQRSVNTQRCQHEIHSFFPSSVHF